MKTKMRLVVTPAYIKTVNEIVSNIPELVSIKEHAVIVKQTTV